jgi:hypothetical protein
MKYPPYLSRNQKTIEIAMVGIIFALGAMYLCVVLITYA